MTFENKADGVKLAGTLTLPKSGGPLPAVLLIPGSSAAGFDRDYATPTGRRAYLTLADYLTRRGIAVLRADDRGVGQSTGNKVQSSVHSLAADAVEAVAFLKSRKEIDPKRIGVLGHSFAGMTVPLAAARSSDITFVITLAGSHAARPERNGSRSGSDWRSQLEATVLQYGHLSALTNLSESGLASRIESLLVDSRKRLNAVEQERFDEQVPDPKAYAWSNAASLTTPLIRSDLLTDPGLGPRNTKVPFLAIYGSLDPTNTPARNVPALISYLTAGGNPDYSLVVVPGLDHNFWVCVQLVPAGGACSEEEYSPKIMQLVGDWILSH